MPRRSDWHQKMFDAFAQAQARQFQWGFHDCFLFAANVVDAMTDGDYVQRIAKDFPYSTEDEALAYIEQYGGMEQLVSFYLHDKIPFGQAQQGDVVLMRNGDHQSVLGICEGVQVVCATKTGILPLHISEAICAWRIA